MLRGARQARRSTCVRKGNRLNHLGAFVGAIALSISFDSSAQTTRVNVSSAGVQANAETSATVRAQLSADGRFVVFTTAASNLVDGDTNDVSDVFVHDRATASTVRISTTETGGQSNAHSYNGGISRDGRFVVFSSAASNLVGGDSNGVSDVFLLDRNLGMLRRISVSSTGVQANAGSSSPVVSGDGQVVAFQSTATNLVAGDTNAVGDVFVHVVASGITTRASVGNGGVQADERSLAADISADGRYVSFISLASNLVENDSNGVFDGFVHDRLASTTQRISISSAGTQANLSTSSVVLSANGRYAAFYSQASTLVPGDTNGADDVFVHDRVLGLTERASISSSGAPGGAESRRPSLSAEGRYVAFFSASNDLAPGAFPGFHVFVRDRLYGMTKRISVSMAGTNTDGFSVYPSISADGQQVMFESGASNLVPGDTNGLYDVFVNQRTDDNLFAHGFE